MEKVTFEEYKKQQEIFFPIDTLEKLELIKKKYDSYILSVEDAQYLEPIDSNLENDFFKQVYYDKLKKAFRLLDLEDDEIRIIILPSFEPEYQVRILKDKILIYRLTSNQWSDLHTGNNLNKSEVKTNHYEIDSYSDIKLSYHIIDAIKIARIPKAKTLVLDGTKYYFLHKSNHGLKIAHKHSPDEKSDTGVLIERVEKMIKELEKTDNTL